MVLLQSTDFPCFFDPVFRDNLMTQMRFSDTPERAASAQSFACRLFGIRKLNRPLFSLSGIRQPII